MVLKRKPKAATATSRGLCREHQLRARRDARSGAKRDNKDDTERRAGSCTASPPSCKPLPPL